MKRGLFFRLSFLIIFFSACLYKYIDVQNHVARLRMELPELQSKIHTLLEENKRLQYEIDQFEHPTHLMELARSIEYSHLKHPISEEILSMAQGVALKDPDKVEKKSQSYDKSFPVAFGAK